MQSNRSLKINSKKQLTFSVKLIRIYLLWKHLTAKEAGMAQMVARRIGNAEVTGSIPVASFFSILI